MAESPPNPAPGDCFALTPSTCMHLHALRVSSVYMCASVRVWVHMLAPVDSIKGILTI
jgi:hypothetical protein